MSSSHREDGLVPIHSVGYWLHYWFWSSTPTTSLTSCFPLVEGLPSWFTRVALLRPGEWTFPSPLFTHHCFIAARSSWCIPAPHFGPGSWVLRRGRAIPARSPDVARFAPPPSLPMGWDDVAVPVVSQFQVTILEGTGLLALGGLRFNFVHYVTIGS
eukprot:Gb_02695 [translate_table: standard]